MAGFTLFNFMCIFKLVGITHLVYALPAEPVCSKYDYEIRTLEAMLRTEQQVANMLIEIKENKNLIAKELESIKTTRDTVSKDLNELNELRSNLNLLVKNVETNISDQVEKMNDKLEKVTDEVTKSGMTVAFSVGNPTKSLVNDVPTFRTTITNIGGAYNIDTGVFTSPVDGLYLFLFTVASSGKNDVYCRIQHNGTNRVRGQTSNDNSYTTASASVYLLLTKGDTVTLGACGGWSGVHSSSDYTTFSGALIKQTY